jgi:prolipoprotein diacylglyceryltransferase
VVDWASVFRALRGFLIVLEAEFEIACAGGVWHLNCARFGEIMAIYGEILGNRSKVAKLDIGHLRKGGLAIYGGLSGFTRRWPQVTTRKQTLAKTQWTRGGILIPANRH